MRAWALVVVVAAACGQPGAEVEYGIGDKADGDGCDPAAELCWPSADVEAMRGVVQAELDLALATSDPRPALDSMIDGAFAIAHKLEPDELDALTLLEAAVAALAPTDLDGALALGAALHDQVVGRALGAYQLAFAVPAGRTAQRALDGKHDDPGGAGDGASNLTLTDGMRESLEWVRGAGAVGKSYAFMLESGGCLGRTYQVLPAATAASWLGTAREARVAAIIGRYARASGALGLIVGVEGLVPIAGTVLSVAHDVYGKFQLHACMAFELAGVFGWDIRVDHNLFAVVTMLMSENLALQDVDVLASSIVVPIVALKLARALGVDLTLGFLRQLAGRGVGLLVEVFRARATAVVAAAAAKGGARAVSGTVLGYATLGLAVLASGAFNAILTLNAGDRLAAVARRPVSDLALAAPLVLASGPARDCAFTAFAAIAQADGRITDLEERMWVALVGRGHYLGGAAPGPLAEREQRLQTCRLGAGDAAAPALACVAPRFETALGRDKLAVLAELAALAAVDGFDPRERALHDDLADELGRRGPALDRSTTAVVLRAVELGLAPAQLRLDPSRQAALAGLGPAALHDYLASPDGPTLVRVRAARAGQGCP